MDLKQRLIEAKRCPVPICEQRKADIKKLLKQGTSRKAITLIYGISYDALNKIRRG
ncbi:hypothetical protein [Vibrio sp. CyArs1]|uniref:hypothetical protein n=1 Tax=Vibrio sp. CyArs1 TaxID=2682577 RepID=UPI001F05D613|nr:hypothetical protein [Vibrio sp. CyArs1]